MKSKKDYWTSKRKDGQWSVKRSGASKASSLHSTQNEAWLETRRLAKGSGSEAFLKDRNGQIRTRNSYDNDPFPPKG
jgi:hypothetical protein